LYGPDTGKTTNTSTLLTIENISEIILKAYEYPHINDVSYATYPVDISSGIVNVYTSENTDPSYGLAYFGFTVSDLSMELPGLGEFSLGQTDINNLLYNSTFTYDSVFYDDANGGDGINKGPFLTQFVNLNPVYGFGLDVKPGSSPSNVNFGSASWGTDLSYQQGNPVSLHPMSMYDLSGGVNNYNASNFFKNFNQVIITCFYDASITSQPGDDDTAAFSGGISKLVKHYPITQDLYPSQFYSPIINDMIEMVETYKIVQFNMFVVDASNVFYTQTDTQENPTANINCILLNRFTIQKAALGSISFVDYHKFNAC
jgi:hypothetical protein